MKRRFLLSGLGASAAAGAVGGCDTPARLASLPEKIRAHAPFVGMPDDCRVLLDGSDDDLLGRIVIEALVREIDYEQASGRPLGPANYLAISGGGENGAFGAGLLTGWTQRGTRPEFKAVTGVSTGALSSPFAFLGPVYDKELAHVYTEVSAQDVMVSRGLLTTLLSDSAYDSTPLLRLIRNFVTPAFMAAIAHEYTKKGRLLFVATTNLDIPEGVLWNMGAIAASGHPRAADLFSRILLASASIPGILPPVMIDIETGGERYQEMHVDGGTVSQVVLYPPSVGGDNLINRASHGDPRIADAIRNRQRRLFVIRNSRPGADQETVVRSTLTIVGRAVSTLIQTQGMGDLYRLYVICKRDGIDYNVAYIPGRFTEKLKEPFDQTYMRKLFALGHEIALTDSLWSKFPPGFDPTPINQSRSPSGAYGEKQ